jgi:WD40 repeat protein/AAA+ ATPase superfamily predicted ATPase
MWFGKKRGWKGMTQHNPPKRRKTISFPQIILIVSLVVALGIVVATIAIVTSQNTTQAGFLVGIIGTVVTMITGILGIMVGLFQWHVARNPSHPDLYSPSLEESQNLLMIQHQTGQNRDIDRNHLPVEVIYSRNPQWSSGNAVITNASLESIPSSPLLLAQPQALKQARWEEWGEAPDIGNFYGREHEQETLKQWITRDHCRVIALLGIGGIGKSALTKQVAETLKDDFRYIYWHSLRNAPLLEHLLKDSLDFFLDRQADEIPKTTEAQIRLLLQYLRDYRSLLVFDNLETIMEEGTTAGEYKQGYEGYDQLIRRIGETKHQSCLLITSREMPAEVARMEGKTAPVRVLHLDGLSDEAAGCLLKDKDLSGSDETLKSLINLYSGNPLLLQIIAEPIKSFFHGDVANFLSRGHALLGQHIRDPIALQFTRLAPVERSVMYWLAIGREGVSAETLKDDLLETTSEEELIEALTSLHRRSFIEPSNGSRFLLQPVITEYVTYQLIQRAYDEFVQEIPHLLASHALIKAQAKDYVRNSQSRLILKPLSQKLRDRYKIEDIDAKAKRMLRKLQQENQPAKPDHTGGNLINLLTSIQSDLSGSDDSDLSGYDFSYLPLRQAYLGNTLLVDASFAYAHLAKSVFAETLGGIVTVALSPDGKELAAAGTNGEIRQWKLEPPSPLATCEDNILGWLYAIAISPDGRLLASGGEDHIIRVWDRKTGQCLKRLPGHSARVWSVIFSPDNRLLLSGSHDQTMRIWDIQDIQDKTKERCLKVLGRDAGRIWSIALSSDGTTLASANAQTVDLWEVSTGRHLSSLTGHTGRVRYVTFKPNSKIVASGSEDRTIRLWDIVTEKCIGIFEGHKGTIRCIAFNPTNQLFASSNDDKTIRLWDSATQTHVATLVGHTHTVSSVAFNSDGQTLVSGSDDQTLKLWEVGTSHCLRTFHGYMQLLESIAFHPDGIHLASGGNDKIVRLWNTQSGQCLKILRGHTNLVRAVAFSPNGKFLASGSYDSTTRLWNIETGTWIHLLTGHTDEISSIAFSSDSKIIASSSRDGTVRLYSTATGKPLKTLQGTSQSTWSVTFSPDGQWLAIGNSDATVDLWKVHTWDVKHLLLNRQHTSKIWSVAFSPDSKILATGSEDETISLWDVETGEHLRQLKGHTGIVRSLSFNANATLLASASDDCTARLWEISSGQNLFTLTQHRNQVRSVAISLHARQLLASCSYDGTIRLWNSLTGEHLKVLNIDRPYERLDITATTGLTDDEKAMLIALGAIDHETEINA